jgi:hypothetical protein
MNVPETQPTAAEHPSKKCISKGYNAPLACKDEMLAARNQLGMRFGAF